MRPAAGFGNLSFVTRSFPHRILRLGAVAALLAACGPGLAAVRSYVVRSPRRFVALMPLTLAPGQRDVVSTCEAALRATLTDRGFVVRENRADDPALPVFGPNLAPPRQGDVQTYGQRLGVPVVLVGRIAQAQESGRGRGAVYRARQRTINGPGGQRERVTENVIVKPAQPGAPARCRLELQLIETANGRVLWAATFPNEMADWTANDAARFTAEQAAGDLAEAYYNRHL